MRADRAGTAPPGVPAVTAGLVGTIALQTAVPPLATDMYTPAFPAVTHDLATSASWVGLTLTAFFLGFAAGQLLGGPWSDQRGRRMPVLVGGLVCTVGAVACALAPSVAILVAARVVQGVGGGVAAAVARAVLVDVAHGDVLARLMSLLQAVGGLAPMVAPVAGALILTAGTWRTVFWALAAFGLLMVASAAALLPESLPPGRRHAGGLRRAVAGIGQVLRIGPFVAYLLTAAFSGASMMAYIANSSYVLQVMKGMRPLTFSLFFAATAFGQVVLSVVNARLVGRLRPRRLILIGLTASALAVVGLAAGVLLWGTPLLLTAVGFGVLMGAQAFVFGNASALAALRAPDLAGAAAAVLGVAGSVAMAVAAPLASSGGGETAVPMVAVMVVGTAGSLVCWWVAGRERR